MKTVIKSIEDYKLIISTEMLDNINYVDIFVKDGDGEGLCIGIEELYATVNAFYIKHKCALRRDQLMK
jgi:hypothetical protein